MCRYDHVASLIDNAVIWTGGNIVKKKADSLFRGKTVAWACLAAMSLRATRSLLSTAQA